MSVKQRIAQKRRKAKIRGIGRPRNAYAVPGLRPAVEAANLPSLDANSVTQWLENSLPNPTLNENVTYALYQRVKLASRSASKSVSDALIVSCKSSDIVPKGEMPLAFNSALQPKHADRLRRAAEDRHQINDIPASIASGTGVPEPLVSAALKGHLLPRQLVSAVANELSGLAQQAIHPTWWEAAVANWRARPVSDPILLDQVQEWYLSTI